MRKKQKRFQRSRWLAEYLLALSLLAFVKILPFRAALRFGGCLGVLAYRIDKRHRLITEGNLAKSFPEKASSEIREIARSVFRNLGYSAVEFFRSSRYGPRFDEYIEIKGYSKYLKAIDKGRGLLLLTGHCGSWELLALAQSIKKPPIGVVVRPLDNPYLDRLISGLRTQYGNSLIGKVKGMREILRWLEQGGAVGILLDQNVKAKEGVFVDFFGRPACTNKGLALMAARTKAPVLPAFIRRVGLDRHEVLVGDEIPLIDTGDKDADVVANTQAYTRAIEGFIRKYPDQWFWMHRRWKTTEELSENYAAEPEAAVNA